MGKFEELSPKARELFIQGMTQKEIANTLDVSETSLVEWKKRFEGTEFDWNERKLKAMQLKKSTSEWLEDRIFKVREQIDRQDGDIIELHDLLDQLLGMRKKFVDSIDILGETAHVMGSFAQFVKKYYPHEVELVKEVTNAFMRYMQL